MEQNALVAQKRLRLTVLILVATVFVIVVYSLIVIHTRGLLFAPSRL